jgi:hypothetical protein
MPPESEWPHVKPRYRHMSPGSPDIDRSERSLGRGLEDVSHLFVSEASAKASGERAGMDTRERGSQVPGVRAGVAVLRRGAPLTFDQLIATLCEHQHALDADIRVIGSRVSCAPCGEIDLLGLDQANRLVIVDVTIKSGDGLLLRGLSHLDWVGLNRSNIQRMFPDTTVDPSRPRLCLVAPAFSRTLQGAVRQIVGLDITCFRYHELAMFGRTGLYVERCGGDEESG